MSNDETNARVANSLSSITQIFERVKLGSEDAAADLWQAYSKRLLGVARGVLRSRGIAPAEASEDSVVNVALAKFFDALSRGRYQGVADRHELWCLLAVITRNNALNRAQRIHTRPDRNRGTDPWLEHQSNSEPTPEEIAALSDTVAWLEQEIRSRSKSVEQADRVIRVMTMTLSGFKQKEIAAAIGQSETTVRQKQKMIRELIERSIQIEETE